MNDFERDDQWQRAIRNRFLRTVYGQWSYEGRYVFIEKSSCSLLVQKRCAVDTFAQCMDRSIGMEEKTERWTGTPRVNFFLETESCTVEGHESPGWMQYGACDKLLYMFAQDDERILNAYLLDFLPLKTWFWQNYQDYKPKTVQNTLNKTRGYPVPILDVVKIKSVKAKRYIFSENNHVRVPLPTTLEEVRTIPGVALEKLGIECKVSA